MPKNAVDRSLSELKIRFIRILESVCPDYIPTPKELRMKSDNVQEIIDLPTFFTSISTEISYKEKC